ncbi:MAG: OmpA family protein [Ignavibacteria bacterium]|jgi:outer membrane protein OmpA-like peptidoglycan-associated protein|nr:OmpA family protein [Ignavibacteria bacterium]
MANLDKAKNEALVDEPTKRKTGIIIAVVVAIIVLLLLLLQFCNKEEPKPIKVAEPVEGVVPAPEPTPAPKPIELKDVLFDHAKFTLKPAFFTELDKVVKLLMEDSNLEYQIEGHCDNTGTDKINNRLSKQRAKAVYDYLISKNISAARLSYQGYGSTQPVADNNTEAGREANRRVVLKSSGK